MIMEHPNFQPIYFSYILWVRTILAAVSPFTGFQTVRRRPRTIVVDMGPSENQPLILVVIFLRVFLVGELFFLLLYSYPDICPIFLSAFCTRL